MNRVDTHIEGLFIVKNQCHQDERGFFFESFRSSDFIQTNFLQDNFSTSRKGVLRGLHFQKGESSQAKLVSVIRGKVFDVVVDLRPDSKTFAQTFAIELSRENGLSLYIPRGFAHGFLTLENETIFHYKCDNYYNFEMEDGIRYNDPKLKIKWPLNESEIILSRKDLELPFFDEKVFQ